VLGTYDTYPEAQAIVDHLAKPTSGAQVSLVGNDLKSVERVTRKLSWSRAALEGRAEWCLVRVVPRLPLHLRTVGFNTGLFIAAILIGAAFGLFFRLVTYAINRRSRTSTRPSRCWPRTTRSWCVRPDRRQAKQIIRDAAARVTAAFSMGKHPWIRAKPSEMWARATTSPNRWVGRSGARFSGDRPWRGHDGRPW